MPNQVKRYKVNTKITVYAWEVALFFERYKVRYFYDGAKTRTAETMVDVDGSLDVLCHIDAQNNTEWTIEMTFEDTTDPTREIKPLKKTGKLVKNGIENVKFSHDLSK